MIVPVPPEDLTFWVDGTAPPSPQLRTLERADVAIVGGGFSGLSAAYHLLRRDPGLDVVILETAVVGSGASGRNTGILRPGVGGTVLELCHRFGEEEAARLYRASVDAVDSVLRLIREEGLRCELEERYHVKVAVTSRQARLVAREAETLARFGFPVEYFDARNLASIVPLPGHAAIGYPQGGQLNPAKLARELKRVVAANGARIFERTRVTAIRPGPTVRLEVPGGAVEAERVVLATNAHTPGLGLLCGQIVPVQSHVSVTAALAPEQVEALRWPSRRSFSDKRHVFDYFRLTSDSRIMFGGGHPAYRPAPGARSAGRTDFAQPSIWRAQRELFARLFPTLADVPITHQWSGSVGMTLDRLPLIGELAGAPGIVFVGGWSGHGVGLATASGALVADLLSGRPVAEDLPWLRASAPQLPPDPFRVAGLSAYVRGLKLADRVDALLDSAWPRRAAPAVVSARAPAHTLTRHERSADEDPDHRRAAQLDAVPD